MLLFPTGGVTCSGWEGSSVPMLDYRPELASLVEVAHGVWAGLHHLYRV